jgi:hypothetical protein
MKQSPEATTSCSSLSYYAGTWIVLWLQSSFFIGSFVVGVCEVCYYMENEFSLDAGWFMRFTYTLLITLGKWLGGKYWV